MNGLLICPGMNFLARKNDRTKANYDQTEALGTDVCAGKTGRAAIGP